MATEAAKQEGVEVEEYLSNVNRLQDGFLRSRDVVDRGKFIKALRDAMLSKQFGLIIGSKNLGKSLILNHVVCRVENEPDANLTIIDVDMRDHPSKELLGAIIARAERKKSGWPLASSKFQKVASKVGRFLASVAVAINLKNTMAPEATEPMASAVEGAIEKLAPSAKEETLLRLTGVSKRNETCIVIDEASLGLPTSDEPSARQAARAALASFVKLTKQTGAASVMLFSSEFGYPFRLQACGMSLQDIQRIIIANEVPKEDMLDLMVKRWNMSKELAELFFSYFGGDIDLCCRGVKRLQEQKEKFRPFSCLDSPGLSSCVAIPDAKGHLRNLAEQGWSPVYDIEQDKAAELIAKKNVGGIIPDRATAFDLPEGIWKGDHKYAIVPSGTVMRWMIAYELERVDSMGARSLDALLDLSLTCLLLLYALQGTGTMSTPPCVWVRQLREDCDLAVMPQCLSHKSLVFCNPNRYTSCALFMSAFTFGAEIAGLLDFVPIVCPLFRCHVALTVPTQHHTS